MYILLDSDPRLFLWISQRRWQIQVKDLEADVRRLTSFGNSLLEDTATVERERVHSIELLREELLVVEAETTTLRRTCRQLCDCYVIAM